MKFMFAFLAVVSAAVAVAQTNQATSPVLSIAAGELKILSKDQLDPGVKDVVEADLKATRLREKAREDDAFEMVPNDASYIRDNYLSHSVGWSESKIVQNLKKSWTNLNGTKFKDLSYVAFLPEGPSKAGPWSSYSRVFKRQDGVLVMLHEWDYKADGGGVLLVKELMNERVNGRSARFIKRKTIAGDVFSELTWATDKKYFTITVWADVPNKREFAYDRAWLNSLANSIE